MKKLLSIILSALLIFCLAGCNVQSVDDYYSSAVKEKPNSIGTVSLSINCNVIKDKVENSVILDAASFDINQDETVYDILLEATAKNKINMQTDGNAGAEYIIAINGIEQQAHGAMSGWLYFVNGESPMVSMANYTLKDGDKIEVLYSTNFGEDLK